MVDAALYCTVLAVLDARLDWTTVGTYRYLSRPHLYNYSIVLVIVVIVGRVIYFEWRTLLFFWSMHIQYMAML
jgi:hypothetical protein